MNGVDFSLAYDDMFELIIEVAASGEKGVSSDQTKALCLEIIRSNTKTSTQ